MPFASGSRQILRAVCEIRTRRNVPIAVIDSHEPFYGPTRFCEASRYAGKRRVGGNFILDTALSATGHSQYISMAHTTGGRDVVDVFDEGAHLSPVGRRVETSTPIRGRDSGLGKALHCRHNGSGY